MIDTDASFETVSPHGQWGVAIDNKASIARAKEGMKGSVDLATPASAKS